MIKTKQDPYLRLREGHETLSEAAQILEKIPRELTEENPEETVEELEKFLASIDRHMLHEEEIAFDVVEAADNAPPDLLDLIAKLREEHDVFREKAQGIRDYIAATTLPIEESEVDTLGLMTADFTESLVTHAQLEDAEFFPRLDDFRGSAG